ncbi:hypothetical protein D3C76_1345860 [compost metagenome]
MLAIVMFVLGGFVGWKVGRRYQDFQELMLARRISKLVIQRDKFAKEQDEYERWERQDERIRKVNSKIGDELTNE